MLNLVIATTNKGKLEEFEKLLVNLPVYLKKLDEFGKIPDVKETGETFFENAELKANYYALATNHWTLADDSGLEVEALGNAPGVFSARYAGEDADHLQKIYKLLSELEKTKDTNRKARFICEMVISDEFGKTKFSARGICNGKISYKPLGDKGFGYDPIFIPEGFSETFGELSNNIKQKISHRAIATQQIIEFLSTFSAS